MKTKKTFKKKLAIYSVVIFAFANFLIPVQNKDTDISLAQLTTVAHADGESDDPEIEPPIYKPLSLWDWFLSKMEPAE